MSKSMNVNHFSGSISTNNFQPLEQVATYDSMDPSLEKEKEKLNTVKALWKDNSQEEVDRLSKKGIVADRISGAKDLWPTVILGRAHEIMEIYKNSHIMFSHGKCFFLSMIDDFIKESIRIHQPSACRSLYKHMRFPGVSSDINNNLDFFDKFKPYEKKFTDNQFADHLISVDWDLLSQESTESALSAVTCDDSIMMRGEWGHFDKIKRILRKNLKPFFQNKNIRKDLIQKVIELVQKVNEKRNKARLGALYLFCIPKDTVGSKDRNFVYLSHKYGKPCDHYEGDLVKTIEGLQSKTVEKVCAGQARILSGPLSNCKGARIFRLEQHSGKRQKLKMKFKKMIEDAQKEDKEVSFLEKQKVIFYKAAAQQGDTEAQFNLGSCYHQGKGVKRNEKKAFKYLQMAADKDHQDAHVLLNSIVNSLLEEKNSNKNQKKQVELLTFFANKGNAMALFKLAGLYVYGEFVEQDLSKATSFFKRAAEKGHPDAKECVMALMNSNLQIMNNEET